jgi:glyoxylase-like metal-dependent hydrolase (beta-lactamase superfamily II)
VFRSELDEGGRVMFAGDTLFAGSIGRTDLPGGDMRTMTKTLRTKMLPLPDDTVVLPGHGPSTTIGRERTSNPFLLNLDELDDQSASGPGRGL